MNAFDFQFLPTVHMGAGRLGELGALAKNFGKKALFVYDPFLRDSELLKRIRADFTANGLDCVEFFDIQPNPRYTSIDAGTKLCLDNKIEVVVAMGGGSAIDSAKAIALVATNGGGCWEYTERADEPVTRPTKAALPLIVIPTTAGTGTEVTNYAVINNQDQKRKCTIISPLLAPKVALIDPEVMATVPAHMTALTGIDTFAHAFESYISVNATPISEVVSLAAIEMFAKSIVPVVQNGADIEARSQMAFACTLAGAAIGMVGVTLPHAIGQPLGALTDAPHGGTLAACLPQVIEWTLPCCEEKFAKVASLMDPKACAGKSTHDAAYELPKIMQKIYKDVNVDVSFGKYGLSTNQIDTLVDLCYSGFIQDMSAHPKQITREDLRGIIEACM